MFSWNSISRSSDEGIRIIATLDAKLQVYSPTYTFILCYLLANIVLFFFGAVDEYNRWDDDLLRAWTIGIARGCGNTLNLNIALEFLLASRMTLSKLRNSIFGAVLPIDRAMPELHSLIGYVSIISAVLHGIFHSIAGLSRGMWQPGFGGWTWCFATGLVLLSLFSVMVTTAMKPMRHKNFERFINVHLVGAFLFFPLICIHGFYNGSLYSYKWVVGPVLVYVVDRFVRKRSENTTSVNVKVSQDYDNLVYDRDIVRLAFPKPFSYTAGQYAELCVPLISETQWHPFTIASSPNENDITFFIKQAGDWTFELHQLCKYGIDSKRNCPVMSFDVRVRGPYGSPAQHVGQYDKILLVSGGVGATPFCSITKTINDSISRQHIERKKLRRQSSRSSLSTVVSSFESTHLSKSGDLGEELPNLSDAGVTFEYSIRRPRRVTQREQAGVFKHPTIGRRREEQDLSYLPAQTWMELFSALTGTISFNTLMLWLILLRFAIDILGIAFHEVDFSGEAIDIFDSTGLTIIDYVLSIISFLLLILAITAELFVERRGYFEDLSLLIPLSCTPIVFHSLTLFTSDVETGRFSLNFFIIIWPLLIGLNLLRYFRVLGRRAFLSESVRRSHQTTKSVDFIWTTPTSADDMWLIDELQRTVGDSKYVRLHRFITRETPPDIEMGLNFDGEVSQDSNEIFRAKGRLCRDHYGRPDWHDIFEKFTANSKNSTTIGIFFCGPSGMAAAVKEAAMHSMLDSRYRGLSNKAKANHTVGIDSLLFSQGVSSSVPDALTRSFNVRYIFREEKF